MKSKITLWQLAGFAISAGLGTLLHFLYDWTGSKFTALFSAVNESTWEHMKLIFFPMFLFAVVQSFFIGKEYQNFWCVKLKGVLISLVLIPVLFYTLNGVFGTTSAFVNIAIFIVAAAVGFICEWARFKKGSKPCKYSKAAFLMFCLITLCFFVFTFDPPKIPLFMDPVNGSYGL